MKTAFKTFYLFLALALISSFLLSAYGASGQKKVFKIAEFIDLSIPDEVIRQADIVVR